MKRFRATLAATGMVIAATLAQSASAATVVDVDWGAGSQSLGTVQSAGTAAEFYNYSNYMANPGFDLELGTAYAFIHENTNNGILSFGMFFTGADADRSACRRAGDWTDCRTKFAADVSGLRADSTVTVRDDRRNAFGDQDATADGANGYYWMNPYTGETDGFVAEGVDLNSEISVDLRRFINMDQLIFVSGNASDPALSEFEIGKGLPDLSLFSRGSSVKFAARSAFAPANISAVPLPAGALLMLSAIGLGGLTLRRRKT